MPKTSEQPAAQPAPSTTAYPHLERLLETIERAQAPQLFSNLRKKVGEINKGPRAAACKKVLAAFDRTDELVSQLIDVRDRLAEEKRSGKARK